MHSNLYQRPQSKQVITYRPPTRNINSQQCQACFQMGRQHQSRKQYTQAIKHYTQAIIHNPLHYKSYCNVGIIYRQLCQYSDAIASYKKALNIKKDDLKTIYNLANVYRLVGNIQNAIQLYKNVIEFYQFNNNKDQLLIDVWNNLGVCYKNMHCYQQAIKCYQKVIQLDNKFQGGYYNKALCLIYLIANTQKQLKQTFHQRIIQAQKLLQQSLKINPMNIMTQINLIQLQYLKQPSKNIYQNSINKLKNFLSLSNLPQNTRQQINLKIGFCLANLQRFQQSAKYYKDGTNILGANSVSYQSKQQPKRVIDKTSVKTNNYDKNPQNSKKNKEQNPIKKKTDSKMISSGGRTIQAKNNNLQQQFNLSDLENVEIQSKKQEKVASIIQTIKQKKQDSAIKQYYRLKPQIDSLCLAKKYDQAIKLLQTIQSSYLKNEYLIIIYGKAIQQYKDLSYSKKAIQIYLSEFQKGTYNQYPQPNFSHGNLEIHKILAQCHTLNQNHKLAIKHYKLIEQYHIQTNTKQDIQTQSGLGINYQSLGLINQAIECYKKSLILQPKNKQILYNLATCYQQGNMLQDGINIYSQCIQLLNKKQDWIMLGDSLINLSICLGLNNNNKQQLINLQKAMKLFDENCKSIQQLSQYYNQQFLLSIYIQLSNLYQEELQMNQQDQKIRQKLLGTYLILLEFNKCPDKNQIIINCGNLLYQKKMYLNTLEYYQQLDSPISNNCLALTYLQINQFPNAYSYLDRAIRANPNNYLYRINMSLIDWIFSQQRTTKEYQNLSKMFTNKYPCKCDKYFQYRLLYGFQFIEELTNIVSINPTDRPQTPISQINIIISNIMNQLQNSINQNKLDQSRLRVRKIIIDQMNKHCLQHSIIDTIEKSQIIEIKFLQDLLKQTDNLQESFNKLYNRLNQNKIKQHPQYPTIIQTLFSILILNNIDKQIQLKSIFTKMFLKQQIKLEINQKQNNNKKIQLNINNLDYQNFIYYFQSWQKNLQQFYSPILSTLKNIYWQSQDIIQPIKIQYNFPRCQEFNKCDQCFLKSAFYCFKFNNNFQKYLKILNVNHNSNLRQKIIQSFQESYLNIEFNTKLITQEAYPITAHCYFKHLQSIQKFIKDLSLQKLSLEKCGKNCILVEQLIKIEFHLGQRNFIYEYIDKILNFKQGMHIIAALTIQGLQLNPFPGNNNQQASILLSQWMQTKKPIIKF